MMMTVEMSMYPFKESYRDLIGNFIVKLNKYPDLRVSTSATSTIIIGEFNYVMKVISQMLEWSYETHGKAVFVTKFIPGHDPEDF